MPNVTIYENFRNNVGERTLTSVSLEIASSAHKARVEEIRRLNAEGKTEEAQQKKQLLPAFTVSATFHNQRLIEHLDRYSGVIHLDFDHIDADKIEEAFMKIKRDCFTYLCFRSPSGKGLKVFVEVKTGKEHHLQAYTQIKRYYEELTGLLADEKCKDITRLCFMSWDPLMYQKWEHYPFAVDINMDIVGANPGVRPSSTNSFEECVAFTEKKKTYINGSRNEFIYTLASNCNRIGIKEDEALNQALAQYDLNQGEIRAAFHSAYKNHAADFASLQTCKLANLQSEQEEESMDYIKNSPLIPDKVYENLPVLLKEGADVFTEKRERDVFLTGALAIVSGCLPKVKGIYDRVEVSPNLYSYIIAPPASGKGTLNFAKMLADEYHHFTLEESKDAACRYKAELKNFPKNDDGDTTPPEKPPFKVVFIPADTSHSKMLWHLQQNGGRGIICETESDTLGNIFKKEWGSYSDLLRKAFHNERVSNSRTTDGLFTEVERPEISLALSGTPNQVTGLIASAEDGLFSRFLFYTFKVDQKWKDVSPLPDHVNLTEHFKALSAKVFEMVLFLQKNPSTIFLSSEQWNKLNNQCSQWLTDVTMFTSEDAASVVKRLGLILYRFAMLFSAMRKAQRGRDKACLVSTTIICTDIDFNNAMELAGIYLEHSKLMFSNLPQQKKADITVMPERKKNFFNALPAQFTRKAAIEKAKEFGLSTKTADNILHAAVGKLLKRVRLGVFERV